MPSPERADSPLVRFYRGDAPDARGRTLDDILAWDDEQLEAVHDYIQWLFPLDEPSRFNPDAPLLTPADRVAFLQPPLAGEPAPRARPHADLLRLRARSLRRRSAHRPIRANGRTVRRNGCTPATITCFA